MAQIIRGTTPTIQFTFNYVPVENINTAVLTIKQSCVEKVEKDITAATAGEKTLSWTLTQAESLSLANGACKIQCNWLLADGTRGASKIYSVEVTANQVIEVIA